FILLRGSDNWDQLWKQIEASFCHISLVVELIFAAHVQSKPGRNTTTASRAPSLQIIQTLAHGSTPVQPPDQLWATRQTCVRVLINARNFSVDPCQLPFCAASARHSAVQFSWPIISICDGGHIKRRLRVSLPL